MSLKSKLESIFGVVHDEQLCKIAKNDFNDIKINSLKKLLELLDIKMKLVVKKTQSSCDSFFYTVYYFHDESDEIYIKFSGYYSNYSSYTGSDFYRWEVVQPQQKIVYE